jgi:hypothetical protein
MAYRPKLILAVLAATTILALTTTSSANTLSISNVGIRVTWRGLELSNNISGGTARCPVTLEGSFHSATIRKVSRALIGYVSRAFAGTPAQCTNGTATINQETLPWHITYEGFRGTLPRITEITLLLIRASLISSPQEGNVCRMTSTTENPMTGIGTRDTTTGAITGARADESRGIPLTNGPGGIFCGLGTGRFSGTGTVSLLGTTNPVSLTLI